MNRPRIFISACSDELRSARLKVAAVVRTLGFDPVTQDDFPTGHGELLAWLREQVLACDGLLQLVGHGYGAEPPKVDPDFGRVSYTQFEFLFAGLRGKRTWVVIAGDGCQRDKAPDLLDLPRDTRHPDPVAWQTERRQLQEAYRDRLKAENHLRHTADSDAELELIVRKLNDELAELRKREERHQRRTRGMLATVLVALMLMAGGIGWGWQQLRHEVQEAGQVDVARIHAHLLAASEAALELDLSEAEQVSGWEQRQNLREVAEAAHLARQTRIESLAAEIAEIEGRGDASTVMREMTRILREENVDAALAYLARERASVLGRVQARMAAARERNRAELEPVLTAAGLEAARGGNDAARTTYEEVLALDPDWPRALSAYAWFLFDRSIQQEQHGKLAVALADASRMLEVAGRLPDARAGVGDEARVQSAALTKMADVLVLRGQAGDAEQALGYYQRSLEIDERLAAANPDSAQAARDVSASVMRLGDFLSRRGQAGDAEQALGHYQRSVEIAERLAAANPDSAQAARDVSVSLERLGDFLSSRGQAGDAEQALGYYQRSLEVRERLAAANPDSAQAARDVSVSLERLGDFLSRRGQAGDAEQALGHYQRSLEIDERLAAANPDSAQAARDVSASVMRLGDFLSRRGQA
ncbi:DUF4062 domain-containing protein, partial [Aquimonas sp.]|uniref:DUF4062 domain-containing protein n=1 Tax=Aquimonas sp. TaxID=1872588 RepID=UPI0037BE3E76